METVVDEIERAIVTLELPVGAIVQLSPLEAEAVYFAALRHFVSSEDRRWWWEALREAGTTASFKANDCWRHIARIVPNPNESVWFIAEENQFSHYPVFETTPNVASAIIGQCYGFEYYLIAKNLSWLLCENHHNVMHAVGSAVEQRLLKDAV